MRGLFLAVVLGVSLAAVAVKADASPAVQLDIRKGPMAAALADLARQARIELLFDSNLVRGMTARPIRGRLSAEAALSRMLAGSGVGYRTGPGGAIVLFAIPGPKRQPTDEASDGAVAELLVWGRRTQNVDIRRTRNDIQPYKVFGRREVEAADRETVDEFLRARESANTQPGPLALGGGDIRSSINLRGFGETSTLVLVDGRRMPFVPSLVGEFSQADINGIPPGAVERIEVLTGAAGGIHGPGAIGGVVNVVLRRDYRGADLTVSGGESTRGDAGHYRLEGRLGFTPDHGATDVMLFVAHGKSEPLRTGRRDFMVRLGRLLFNNAPDAYGDDLSDRNGVSVVSRSGDLTLDPEYGGAALGAMFTFLPLGFSGTRAEAAALLVANAGKLPTELTDDLAGKRGYISTAPSVTSGVLNVRRRVHSSVEVFLDGLYLRNRGRFAGTVGRQSFQLGPGAAGNPFGQVITLSFPVGVRGGGTSYGLDVTRWTVGTIVNLPRGWKASADHTIAQSRVRWNGQDANPGLSIAVASGRPGPNGEPPVRPFEDWAAVVAALPAYVESNPLEARLRSRFRATSLRVSGPLLELPGGPLTATFLGEDRRDRVADSSTQLFGFDLALPSRTLQVRSGYVELRAPLGALDADNTLLRGLEVQLAARHDRSVQHAPAQAFVFNLDDVERFSVRNTTTTFTAGARLRPMSRLMLRGSIATGERPPTLADLQYATGTPAVGPADPRRAGRTVGSEGPLNVLVGGSTRVRSARARSFTVGAVFNPEGLRGPRVSLDYSRIVVTREPVPFPLTLSELLANEAQYPERVVRAPLTATDRAQGLTAGRVLALDTTAVNLGRTVVEAVDVQLDWLLPTSNLGDFRLYGALTWQPTFQSRATPDAPTIESIDYPGSPLKWRGNVGVEWARGPLSVDLNVQYYGSYRVGGPSIAPVDSAALIRQQGAPSIPAQPYVDLSVRRHFTAPLGPGPLRTLDARLSIHNLLDRSPPIVARSTTLGFSEYGDPRRRRITASLSARF